MFSISVNYALVQYRECKIWLSWTKDCNISLKSAVSKRSTLQSCYILFEKFPEGSEASQQDMLSRAASRNSTCFGLDLVWPCSCGTCITVNVPYETPPFQVSSATWGKNKIQVSVNIFHVVWHGADSLKKAWFRQEALLSLRHFFHPLQGLNILMG